VIAGVNALVVAWPTCKKELSSSNRFSKLPASVSRFDEATILHLGAVIESANQAHNRRLNL
jgi:hypothetical protein